MKNLKKMKTLRSLAILLGLSFILAGCGSGLELPTDEPVFPPPVDGGSGDGGAALTEFIAEQLELPDDDYSLQEPVPNVNFCPFDQTVSYLWTETIKGAASRIGKIAEISGVLAKTGAFDNKDELLLALREEQAKKQVDLAYVQRAVVEKKLSMAQYIPELDKLKSLDEKLNKDARSNFRDEISKALDAYQDAPKAVDGYDKMLVCVPIAKPCEVPQVILFKEYIASLRCDEANSLIMTLAPTYCYDLNVLLEALLASECPARIDCQKLFESADSSINMGDCLKARSAMQSIDSFIALKYCESSYLKAKYTFDELTTHYRELCAKVK